MTYKKQMEGALKEYLKPLGFKYNASEDSYIRKIDQDTTHAIGYTIDSGYRKNYYHLRFFITISSNTLNDILYEITNEKIDCRRTISSPTYINLYDDEIIEMEFCGIRTLEENIQEFDSIYRLRIQNVFNLYNSQRLVFTCPLYEKYFNVLNTPRIWYYVPIAYFFNNEFNKAFEFIEERIGYAKDSESRIIARYGVLEDEDILTRKVYETMRNNLKSWIAERRQFKVDDEYLPRYDEMSTENGSSVHKIRSFIKELLK